MAFSFLSFTFFPPVCLRNEVPGCCTSLQATSKLLLNFSSSRWKFCSSSIKLSCSGFLFKAVCRWDQGGERVHQVHKTSSALLLTLVEYCVCVCRYACTCVCLCVCMYLFSQLGGSYFCCSFSFSIPFFFSLINFSSIFFPLSSLSHFFCWLFPVLFSFS